MKIGKNKLKMTDGSVKTFKSEKKRDNFERVANAYKHGWRPKKVSEIQIDLIKRGYPEDLVLSESTSYIIEAILDKLGKAIKSGSEKFNSLSNEAKKQAVKHAIKQVKSTVASAAKGAYEEVVEPTAKAAWKHRGRIVPAYTMSSRVIARLNTRKQQCNGSCSSRLKKWQWLFGEFATRTILGRFNRICLRICTLNRLYDLRKIRHSMLPSEYTGQQVTKQDSSIAQQISDLENKLNSDVNNVKLRIQQLKSSGKSDKAQKMLAELNNILQTKNKPAAINKPKTD